MSGATMGRPFRLQKAGSGLLPLLEGADRNLLLEQGSSARCGEAAQTTVGAGKASMRSAVAALIESNWLRHSSVICR